MMIMDDATDSRTLRVLREGMEAGLHVGAQLHAMIGGQTVADVALGAARLGKDAPHGADVPMHADTLMLWLWPENR